jgi:adenylosuccinate lyase
MIPRYTRPDMAAIWSPETRFRIWFEIEAHAADAMAEVGHHPPASASSCLVDDVIDASHVLNHLKRRL